LKSENDTLKDLPFRCGVGAIALEVEVQTTAAQLSTEIPKWE
jgi:hypothetical protein